MAESSLPAWQSPGFLCMHTILSTSPWASKQELTSRSLLRRSGGWSTGIFMGGIGPCTVGMEMMPSIVGRVNWDSNEEVWWLLTLLVECVLYSASCSVAESYLHIFAVSMTHAPTPSRIQTTRII